MNEKVYRANFCFALLILIIKAFPSYCYDIEKNLDRCFQGIGAISGGGATSKLLINYREPPRSEILDYLFKPNFGASLQILKVEIGGDSQSTDGAESSHMHSQYDENYERGYEWWLMKEAKKRNSAIKLYGLPWVFPGWLGNGTFSPYYNRTNLVKYILNWIKGAKNHHGLDIDYIGVWNERPYDIEYIYMLKQGLIAAGFGHVQTVAGDAMSWKIVDDYINSTILQKSLDIIGYHYPGSYSPPKAKNLPIPLWASEEYSARNDISGGGCWARVLNEGYVNGLFTAYIAWNLITSYYDNLPYSRSSLMTANQPWSGYYEVNSPIWMTAHHTQFTEIGWHYLKYGSGTGNLTGNGTYVSYVSPEGKQLTIVLETLDPSTSPCFYPMPKYTVAEQQNITFKLGASFSYISILHVFYSHLYFDGTKSILFEKQTPIKLKNGTFTLVVNKNEVYTLTTVNRGQKGSHSKPPPPKPFPVPYEDNFEDYAEYAEPYNLVQQAGVWEVRQTKNRSHGKVIKQVVPEPPIDTCLPERMPHPVALIGNFGWAEAEFKVDVFIEDPPDGASGVFIGALANAGGSKIMYANGVYFWLYPHNNTVLLTGNFSRSVMYQKAHYVMNTTTWYTIGLLVQDGGITCQINSQTVMQMNVQSFTSKSGFLTLGTTNFGSALFDNLNISMAREGYPVRKETDTLNNIGFSETTNKKNNKHTRL